MSFGNDWTSAMIVHKVREKELLNQAENERVAKALKNEEEPRRAWNQPQISKDKQR
jgi:hypothetical protein